MSLQCCLLPGRPLSSPYKDTGRAFCLQLVFTIFWTSSKFLPEVTIRQIYNIWTGVSQKLFFALNSDILLFEMLKFLLSLCFKQFIDWLAYLIMLIINKKMVFLEERNSNLNNEWLAFEPKPSKSICRNKFTVNISCHNEIKTGKDIYIWDCIADKIKKH